MSAPMLLFDDSCPMCRVYTGAFEQLGWAGRSPLGQCDQSTLARLDLDRARHEIPMIDPTTGEVHYGLDALTKVIGSQRRALGAIMRWPVTQAVARPLYWFISYNRREMAGCPPPATGFDCAPDFHRGWTSAYLALSGAVMLVASRTAGAATAITLTAATATFSETIRNVDQNDRLRVGAQAATAGVVATAVTAGARAAGAPSALATVAGAAAGVHQVWRRRFLRTTLSATHRKPGGTETGSAPGGGEAPPVPMTPRPSGGPSRGTERAPASE